MPFSSSSLSEGRETGLTKPQYRGRQAGWVLRAYKKPFNYLCLVRLKVTVTIEGLSMCFIKKHHRIVTCAIMKKDKILDFHLCINYNRDTDYLRHLVRDKESEGKNEKGVIFGK